MSQIELFKALKEIHFTKHLNVQEMGTFMDNGQYHEMEKGNVIFSEGNMIDKMNILLKGVVKVTKLTDDHREVLKSILHPKTIIDELSFCGSEKRSSNAIVMSPLAGIYQVDIRVVNDIVSNNMDVAKGLICYMGNRLKFAEERLESFVLNDARERIVEFLKVNAESFGQPIGFEMLLKHNFTQQDIANYTGTSRQTVTMVLNDLKKTNKIHFKRQSILIRDLKALV